jgi:hypothetical protein
MGVGFSAPGAAKPGPVKRFMQAVNYTISGVTPSTWMSPMQPLKPMAPAEVKGRQWDYPVAFNLNYIPRTSEPIKFSQLNALARNNNICRGVIETRKDQVEALDWHITPMARGLERKKIKDNRADEIFAITKFFAEGPARAVDWGQWIRGILEQHYVYDAVAVHKRKNRGGKLFELEQLDASTITVLIDQDGRIPLPPDPAYQQVLKGIPAADYASYTQGDLVYAIKNWRPDHMYGCGPVEQTVAYVEMSIARVREQMAYYTTGDVPRGVVSAPPGLTMEQIEQMQAYWESIFAGNIEQRSRLWFLPGGSEFHEFQKEVLFNEFDEWLARVICYAFSINPQPFVKMMNRGTAQVSQEQSAQEGLLPTSQWIARFITKLIRTEWGIDDLMFSWKVRGELDPTKQSVIANTLVRAGIWKIDEARDEIGIEPVGGAASELLFATANGYVHVDPQEQQDLQTQGQVEQMKAQAKFAPKPAPGGPGQQGPGNGSAGQGKGQGGPPKGKGGASGRPAAGVGLSDAPKGGFNKVDGVELACVERPLMNPFDLTPWAASQGIQLEEDIVLTNASFVTGGVPLIPASLTMHDFLPMVIVEGGQRSLDYDEAGVWLVFESPTLTDEATLFSNYGDSGLRILLSRETVQDENGNDVPNQPGTGISSSAYRVPAVPTPAPYTGMLLFGEMDFNEDPWGLAKVTNEEISQAASETKKNPTLAERDAGNYKKGTVDFHGIPVSIENAEGSIREGRHGGWKAKMPTDYGYVRGTHDADGDATDVFIGKNPDSKKVYVIDQVKDDGTFDEHKSFLGYNHWAHAQKDYLDSYRHAEQHHPGKAHHNIGSVHSMTIEEYKQWLKSGKTKQPINPHLRKKVSNQY